MKIFLLLALFCATAYGQSSGCAGGIKDCGSCRNPELECTTCLDRWWWKDPTACIKCPDHCNLCKDSNGDDKTECVTCDDYYYKTDDSQCHWCNGHCQDCNGDWQCNKCAEHYRIESEESIACLDCSAGCEHCLDGGVTSCVDCLKGFYYSAVTADSGRCIACGANCKECTSGTTCDLCKTGYTWTGSSCVACIDHCDNEFCLTNGACTKCVSGYFLTTSSHQCRTCAHCADCPDVGGCVTCEDGYILNSDGTCQPCPNVDDAATCVSCASSDRGRIFTGSFCDYCPKNCVTCSATDMCITCKDGFYVESGACIACDASCVTCSGAGADKCLTCEDGFGRISFECKKCSEATSTSCKLCSGSSCDCGSCECESGFFQTDTATENSAVCRSCSAFEPIDSENSCTQCAPSNRGRFMSANKCVGCSTYGAECLTCDGSKCTLCSDGFYFNAGTSLCTACTDSANCKHCSTTNAAMCTTCNDGYWSSSGTCLECPVGCKTCSNSFTCDTCNDGLFELYEELCPKCTLDNCKTCATIDTCTECMPRYHPNANPITACEGCTDSHCLTCVADKTMCTLCEDGYTHVSGVCEACGVGGCKVCTTDSDVSFSNIKKREILCDTCDDTKYAKNVDICFACHSTCETCLAPDDAAMCDVCKPNHHSTDDTPGMAATCTPCHISCNGCSANTGAANTCSDCAAGYTKHMTSCYQCDATCKTCSADNNPSACVTCVSGKSAIMGVCVQCHADCLTCAAANDNMMCLTCAGNMGPAAAGVAGSCMTCHATCSTCTQAASDAHCLTCSDPTMTVPAADGTAGTCGTMCHADCATCHTASMANACKSCTDSSKYLHMGSCFACHNTCGGKCDGTADSNCLNCAAGTGLPSPPTAGTCAACDMSCMTCDKSADPTRCLTCVSGKVFTGPAGGVGKCVDQCTTAGLNDCFACDGTGCTTCHVGLAPYTTKQCAGCESDCKECSDETTCTVCNDGHFKSGSDCGSTICVPNCEVCASASACTTCKTGYIVSADSMSCLACADKCEACANNALHECTTCDAGYSDQNVCQSCTNVNCKICSSADVCTTCNDKFYKTLANACSACSDSNCKTCPNNICTACDSGFELTGSTCTAKNGEGISNCLDANSGVCVECNPGYFLDPTSKTCVDCTGENDSKYSCLQCKGQGGQQANQDWLATCEDCPVNCVQCTSATTCSKCVDGMYTDGMECFQLVCTVSAITHQTACSACSTTNYNSDDEKRGLFWDSGSSTCKECPRNCVSCTSETSCSSCTGSFVWSAAQTACIECDFSVDTKCIGCASSTKGRYLDSEGKCLLCPDSCTRCTDATTCTACASTHYLSGTTCKACTSADITTEGCTSCQSTYGAWATNVHAWFSKPVEGAEDVTGCFECPTNCAECSELNTCTKCFSARYFSSNAETSTYECKPCLSNCDTCSNGDSCDQCHSGYYYKTGSANTCESCPPQCSECTHSDGCTACVSGYYLAADKTCKACTGVSNCLTCTLTGENVQCLSCKSTFYPKELNGVIGGECASCIANCDKCTSDTGCVECSSGSCYDEEQQKCHANAGKNCDACELRNDVVSCKTCEDGAYLDMCQTCKDSKCLVCDVAADKCTSCQIGSYLDGDKCTNCPTGCLACADGTSCTTCRDATYWDTTTSQCLPCLSKCAECSNPDTCVTCASENTFKDTSVTPNACVDCLAGCYNCTNADVCDNCHASFYPVKDDAGAITGCTHCGTGCGACTEAAGVVTCDECIVGYTLIAGVCQACSAFSNCAECADKNNNAVLDTGDCIQCAPGTVMSDDNSQCLSCTLQGCEVCQDRNFICEQCNNNLLPSPNSYACGDPCWFCEGEDECNTAPSLNGTMPKEGSAYRTVGCTNGCAVFRNQSNDGIVYLRTCLPKDDNCDSLSSESCDFYGEEESKVTECKICCRGELCNIQELTGESAGAEFIRAGIFMLLLGLTLAVLL